MSNLVAKRRQPTTTSMATSVQDVAAGVTFHFDQAMEVGTYWNGQPFVVSGGNDVVLTQITPASVDASGRVLNGTMVNPLLTDAEVAGGAQGFDGFFAPNAIWGYNSSLNEDPGITSANLVIDAATYPKGASIIKAVSNATFTGESGSLDELDAGNEAIGYYGCLTVVPRVPPANAFRPPVTAISKESLYTLDDLDYSVLKNLDPVTGQVAISEMSNDAGRFYMTWTEYADFVWYLSPNQVYDGYFGREIARVSNRLIALHTNYTNAEKETVYASLVQAGLDVLSSINRGFVYNNNWTKIGYTRIFSTVAAVALNIAKFKSDIGKTDSTWTENDQFQYVDNALLNTAIVEGLDAKAEPVTGIELQSEEIGLASAFIPNSSTPRSGWIRRYMGIHTHGLPVVTLALDMLNNGEGRAIWGDNHAYFEFGTRVQRIHEIDRLIYESPSTIYQPSVARVLWATTYHNTFSSSVDQFPPEIYSPSPALTFGSTTIDVAIADNWYPGSAPINRYDVRHSEDGTNWTQIDDVTFPYQITGLTPLTFYYVQVRAHNTHGISPWSPNQWRMSANGVVAELNSAGITTGLSAGDSLAAKTQYERLLTGFNADYKNLAPTVLNACGYTTA